MKQRKPNNTLTTITRHAGRVILALAFTASFLGTVTWDSIQQGWLGSTILLITTISTGTILAMSSTTIHHLVRELEEEHDTGHDNE